MISVRNRWRRFLNSCLSARHNRPSYKVQAQSLHSIRQATGCRAKCTSRRERNAEICSAYKTTSCKARQPSAQVSASQKQRRAGNHKTLYIHTHTHTDIDDVRDVAVVTCIYPSRANSPRCYSFICASPTLDLNEQVLIRVGVGVHARQARLLRMSAFRAVMVLVRVGLGRILRGCDSSVAWGFRSLERPRRRDIRRLPATDHELVALLVWCGHACKIFERRCA